MSLTYEYHGDNYKYLSEENKSIIHNTPLAMYAAGIGVLDEGTLKEFVYRANILHLYTEDVKCECFAEVLPITLNCATLSRKDWIKQKFMNRYIIAEFSAKDATDADRRATTYRVSSGNRRNKDTA